MNSFKDVFCVTAIVIILIFLPNLFAQEGWVWQNPLPQGNRLYDVHFISNPAGYGWAVGIDGTILHSTDGGVTWEFQNSGTSANLEAVYFVDQNLGWAVGSEGTILHTSNGGTEWSSQAVPTAAQYSYLYDVHFINPTTGWVVGENNIILHTTNGGTTPWTYQYSTLVTPFTLTGIHFVNETTGWIAGSYGLILQTTNGGGTVADTSWITLNSGTSEFLTDIFFIDSYNGVAVGFNGTIIQTANGGNYWSSVPSAGSESLESIFFTSGIPSVGWIVGSGGAIYRSDNLGASWLPQTSETSTWLYGIHFTDTNNGWAVGSGGQIIHTDDGGANPWFSQTIGTSAHLANVFFTDEMNGWAVGQDSTILHTSDGGDAWDLQTPGTSQDLNDIFFSDANQGWAVGDAGIIMHTSNAGATAWTPQSSGTDNTLRAVHFISNDMGWAVGDAGTILYTNNAGGTWSSIDIDLTWNLYDVHFVNSTTGWAVGEFSPILYTTDGGDHWSQQPYYDYYSIHFTDNYNGWAAGRYGSVIHTTDGGVTWNSQTTGIWEDLNYIYFLNDSRTGWAVGWNGLILRTTDGGDHWYTQSSGTSNSLYGAYFHDVATGWVVGSNGTILYTADGGGSTNRQKDSRNHLNLPMLPFQTTTDNINTGLSKTFTQNKALVGVEVSLDTILHSSDGDLEFFLTHLGITDTLVYQVGGTGDNFIKTTLTDAADIPITSGTAPFTGRFRPFKPLSQFAGIDPNGTWTLGIYNGSAGTTGTLQAWSLTLYFEEVTGIIPNPPSAIGNYRLYQNYPNPFNPVTNISFVLPHAAKVRLDIYNILGQRVATIVNNNLPAGEHKVKWDGSDHSSGIYFYQLTTDNFSKTNRMVLIK
jgi:photosystem II stability/assembly factor-like uncharacterized protein